MSPIELPIAEHRYLLYYLTFSLTGKGRGAKIVFALLGVVHDQYPLLDKRDYVFN